MTSAPASHQDLVPLADRLRYMQIFRLGVAAVLLTSWLTLPVVHRLPLPELGGITAGYLLLAFIGEAVWRAVRRRGLLLLGALLIVDGAFLAWLTYATGGAASPLRGLILVHVIAVALLASFRTGVKISIWHSLLALMVFHAAEAGLVAGAEPGAAALGGPEFRLLLINVIMLWAVAIATASFAAVNERELRRRRYDLEALAGLAYRLESTTDPLAVAETLVDAVIEEFGFPRAALITERDGAPSLLAGHGLEPAPPHDTGVSSSSVMSHARLKRDALRVSRLDRDADRWLCRLFCEPRNLVIVPLHADGRAIAMLVIEHGLRRGSRIEHRVVSIVERFASQSALALANAWLLDHVQRLATCDGLTGLPNRRQLEAALGREVARWSRNAQPFSVMMIDIDHFKRLNDDHGHVTGDAALRAVAERLAQTARGADVVARYGGEEFAVVLPGVEPQEALVAAERLRHAIAAIQDPAPLTASIGVATYPLHADDPTALLEAADRALYQSKRSGRNRTTISTSTFTRAP